MELNIYLVMYHNQFQVLNWSDFLHLVDTIFQKIGSLKNEQFDCRITEFNYK